MKAFHSLVVLRHPPNQIAAVIRDRLSEIAPALSDVEAVRTIERFERPDGAVKLINEWRVNPKLPSSLNGIVTNDMLGWLDHAEWSADLSRCTWRIEPFFVREAISCEGATKIEAAMGGRGARATFEGTLAIDPTALSRIPTAWRQAAVAAIELLIGGLIPKNFRKTADAAAALVAAGSSEQRGVMEPEPGVRTR